MCVFGSWQSPGYHRQQVTSRIESSSMLLRIAVDTALLQESGTAYCTYGAVVGKQTSRLCLLTFGSMKSQMTQNQLRSCKWGCAIPFAAEDGGLPRSTAAALRASLSRLGAQSAALVSRRSFGVRLLRSARQPPALPRIEFRQ